jgi:hypothetical protein
MVISAAFNMGKAGEGNTKCMCDHPTLIPSMITKLKGGEVPSKTLAVLAFICKISSADKLDVPITNFDLSDFVSRPFRHHRLLINAIVTAYVCERKSLLSASAACEWRKEGASAPPSPPRPLRFARSLLGSLTQMLSHTNLILL